VLFFHLLRELDVPEVKLLGDRWLTMAETFKEKLTNWTVLNEVVLRRLNLEKSEWYLEFVVNEEQGYVEEVRDHYNFV